jgi:putative copper resistance protein D
MILFGSSLFTRFLASGPLADFIAQRLRYLILIAAVLALVAIVAMAPIAVIRMAGSWHQAMRPGIATTILRETISGRMLIIRFSLAVLLMGSCLMSPRLGLRTVAAAGLLLASFAFSGHAVADDGAQGLIHRGNDIVHLIAAAAWLGSLVPLLPCLAALRRPELRAESYVALRNFSFAGHGAVALVLVTGVVNALLVIGPPMNWLTPSLYHILLLAKIALVACMVGLALVNRYVWVPRMKSDMEIVARAITRRTIAELLLGLGVLALVALFGQLDPG